MLVGNGRPSTLLRMTTIMTEQRTRHVHQQRIPPATDRIILGHTAAFRADAVLRRRSEGVTPQAIEDARVLLRKYLSPHPSPLTIHTVLSSEASEILGRPMTIAVIDATAQRPDEHRTGSFKDYAPIELYARAERGDIPREVHVVSTGNHALATVNAAARVNAVRGANIRAIATMDIDASAAKKQAIREAGGTVREHVPLMHDPQSAFDRMLCLAYDWLVRCGILRGKGIRSYKEGEDIVNAMTSDDCMRIPHDNVYTANGYSVLAVEAIEQLAAMGIDVTKRAPGSIATFAPMGSGGLMRGWLEWSARTTAMVFGVSAPPATSTFDSLREGRPLRIEVPSDSAFACDGILATTESSAFDEIRALADGALLVHDMDAVVASGLLLHCGFVSECTSGLPLAGLFLHDDLVTDAGLSVIVLTSNHLDPRHRATLERWAEDPDAIRRYFAQRRNGATVYEALRAAG